MTFYSFYKKKRLLRWLLQIWNSFWGQFSMFEVAKIISKIKLSCSKILGKNCHFWGSLFHNFFFIWNQFEMTKSVTKPWESFSQSSDKRITENYVGKLREANFLSFHFLNQCENSQESHNWKTFIKNVFHAHIFHNFFS